MWRRQKNGQTCKAGRDYTHINVYIDIYVCTQSKFIILGDKFPTDNISNLAFTCSSDVTRCWVFVVLVCVGASQTIPQRSVRETERKVRESQQKLAEESHHER